MAMTYATVTGRIVIPGTTTGIPGELHATPLTEGGVLAFPTEDYTTVGPAVANVTGDGTIEQEEGVPGLNIPTDVPSGTLWRLTFVPKGKGNLPVRLGDYEISASADIADLVAVNPTVITPTMAAKIEEGVAALSGEDTAVAFLVEDPDSATATALSATYATVATVADKADTAAVPTIVEDTAGTNAFREQYDGDSRAALRGFEVAVASRNLSPVKILCMGDSVVEGVGATVWDRKWIKELQRCLTARMPVSGLTEPGMDTIWGWNMVEVTHPHRQTITGTVGGAGTDLSKSANYGAPRRDIVLRTAAAKWSATFTGTSVKVHWVQDGGFGSGNRGILGVKIDGGAITTIDTYGASGVQQTWTSPALTAGSHTIEITRDVSSGTTATAAFSGISYYNGDESKGFHVWDGGHAGYRADSYSAAASLQTDNVAAINPDAIVFAFGLNDIVSKTAAEFETNLTALVTASVAGVTGKVPALVFVAYPSRASTLATWPDYVAKMYAVAAAKGGYMIDLTTRLPDQIGDGGANTANFNIYADATHPSDRGHAVIGSIVADVLTPR